MKRLRDAEGCDARTKGVVTKRRIYKSLRGEYE